MSQLAIFGGEPVRTKPWPSWPDVREEDIEAVSGVVASGDWWMYAGEETSSFQSEFAAYQEAEYGITVNSGTTALQVALEALGIGPGDEVIVPAYSFQATAMSVILASAVPIFADIEPDTLNIDPDAVSDLVTERTRAVIPVHLAGLPADMLRLGQLAESRGILLLEDAAQAHGAVWRGRKVGAVGDAGTFSFQASKNLCSGEGGIVLTNDGDVAARAAGLRDCGRVAGRPFYEHHLPGYNFRMTEMQSALLRSRLRHLEAETQRRWRNGGRLTELLTDLQGIEPIDPHPADGDRRAYHTYAIRLHPEHLGGVARAGFLEALGAEGIPCSEGYGHPLYRNPVFQEENFRPKGCPVHCPHYPGTISFREVLCPAAEESSERILWLFHNLLLGTDDDINDIFRGFEKVVTHRGDLIAEQG
jgi:dTDP-4-amino-4,6-dideoxygalactose transaminase